MSLFDVIKYGGIDIRSKDDTEQLPPTVIKAWLARIVEHACQNAQTYHETYRELNHGNASFLTIESIREYMSGNIELNSLEDIADYSERPAYNVYLSALQATKLNTTASIDTALGVIRNWSGNAAINFDGYDSAQRLYKEWLMEELLAFGE